MSDRRIRARNGLALALLGLTSGLLLHAALLDRIPLPDRRVPVPEPPHSPMNTAVQRHPARNVPAADVRARSDGGAIAELRRRDLTFPVTGYARALRDTFDESRGTRRHEALDILAPRMTPVVAVEDGRIAKLFESRLGGLTIYQFDASDTYCYYYAHLERYADHTRDGSWVSRGETIAYVGTSGNAPPGTPHLHFAIFRLTPEKQWWKGKPIDPFPVFRQ